MKNEYAVYDSKGDRICWGDNLVVNFPKEHPDSDKNGLIVRPKVFRTGSTSVRDSGTLGVTGFGSKDLPSYFPGAWFTIQEKNNG